MFSRSIYEKFVADFITIMGPDGSAEPGEYTVLTNVRYKTVSGNKVVSKDIDVVAIPVKIGRAKPVIGLVEGDPISIDYAEKLAQQLTEGKTMHRGEEVGLGAWLEKQGFTDVDRYIYAWSFDDIQPDQVRERLKEKGVKAFTFPELLEKLIEATWKRLDQEGGWFEQQNHTQLIISMLLRFHKYETHGFRLDKILGRLISKS